MVDSDETLNHTFTKFRELQQRWKETGIVPQQHVKDLWETYNLHVENFYNFIKINKELRDLDLKKNYEQKVALCEQAEALVMEPSVVAAFHKLQKLHDEWRETGPVANEFKESLWERFKAASSRINKAHQDHFEALKAEQVRNLELKSELCAATEELVAQPMTTRREWNRASDRLLEIQKTWKTIGFAPRKDNNRIYERFRTACDKFFEAKRRFYADVKTEMEHNLQLKTEICEAAEALVNSEEWKKTTDELIALQARWKQIGAVSRRHSDAIWKRFRTACDQFFERKGSHFATVDGEHEENLRRKQALLDEMAEADVKTGGYEVIREFQRRWGEIGFVPIKQKDSIQKRYKAAVDALFDTLRGSERDRSMNRFREKVSSMKASGDRRLRSERERLYNKVRQLEQEIGLLENNIGFFARSKNAEALIADVRAKIERAREEMAATVEKVKLIDRQAAAEQEPTQVEKEIPASGFAGAATRRIAAPAKWCPGVVVFEGGREWGCERVPMAGRFGKVERRGPIPGAQTSSLLREPKWRAVPGRSSDGVASGRPEVDARRRTGIGRPPFRGNPFKMWLLSGGGRINEP